MICPRLARLIHEDQARFPEGVASRCKEETDFKKLELKQKLARCLRRVERGMIEVEAGLNPEAVCRRRTGFTELREDYQACLLQNGVNPRSQRLKRRLANHQEEIQAIRIAAKESCGSNTELAEERERINAQIERRLARLKSAQ